MKENTSKIFVGGDANPAAVLLSDGQGTPLFVINLCASQAPVANVGKTLPGLETYRLYQVARREDGRTRYRLRLGFFTSEADAETALNAVRDAYPTAFTACLCDEDHKFARGFVPEGALSAPAPKPVAVAPRMAVVENKAAPKVEPVKVAAARPAPAAPVAKAAAPVAAANAAPAAKVAPSAKAPATDTVTVKALTPAAKPVPAPAAKAAAPAASNDATAKHKRLPDPSTKVEPVAKKPAAPVAAAPAHAEDEIELSWDLPALELPTNVAPAPQVLAPSFRTQEVIKAPAPPAAKAPAKSKPVEAPKVEAAKPTAPSAPVKKDTIAAPSKLLANIELTLESEPAAAPAKSAAPVASNEPFRVGKGVEIPTSSLSLQSEPTKAPAPAVTAAAKPSTPAPAPKAPAIAASAPAKPVVDVSKMKAAHANASDSIKAAVTPASVRKVDGPPPDLDSTQTIRALTSDELKDDSQEKWFAIQLAVSDQPVNLDTMPRLDIFEAYRLYSVASAGSGKITHSLRIGFFREDHSAEAVCGYLKTFFNSPSVVRISIAEQARFKDAPAPKPAAKSEGKVLDLSHARDRAPKVVPTVTMEVDTKKFDPLATGSFKASNATGTHKALQTGAHNALNATGTHSALSATGTHRSLKAASKSSTPPTKRSAPLSKGSATGKHKALQTKKSLSQQLMDEAREVELSQSAIRKLPKNDSLFSKMFGKKK